MVNANGVAIFLLTAASAGTVEQARAERSWFGKKINKADYIRVQEDRLRRLEERIEKMSAEGAMLAERARQHREMRLKSSSELRDKVSELQYKLQNERERLQQDFEEKMVSVREEMWAQAARDRNTLEAELGARNEREKKKMLEEARDRAESMVQEVRAEMTAEAERERELHTQRAALAEEGRELARKDKQQLQEEKDELVRQLQEAMEVEDANRKKIILKFKSRENTLRKNFEAQLREARTFAREERPASPDVVARPHSSKSKAATNTSAGVEAAKRAAMKTSSSNSGSNGSTTRQPNAGASGNGVPAPGASATPQQ